jgi:hypothetical protein
MVPHISAPTAEKIFNACHTGAASAKPRHWRSDRSGGSDESLARIQIQPIHNPPPSAATTDTHGSAYIQAMLDTVNMPADNSKKQHNDGEGMLSFFDFDHPLTDEAATKVAEDRR